MRPILSAALALSLSPLAHAGAGVSPFLAVVSPDALPRSVTEAWDFSGEDAVYVMDAAAADSVSWRGYVWGPHGEPVVGRVSADVAAEEILTVVDPSALGRTALAVVDEDLLQALVDEALVGPCGHEPELLGLVQADRIDPDIARLLRGLDDAEPAVAVAAYGLDTAPVTDLSARYTGGAAVTIINPDSMIPRGWCGANPTPHP